MFHDAFEAQCECTSQNFQIGINPPKWANHTPNQPKQPQIADKTWMR